MKSIENDAERNKIQTLKDKQNLIEGQLDQIINQITEAKERQMNLIDAKE